MDLCGSITNNGETYFCPVHDPGGPSVITSSRETYIRKFETGATRDTAEGKLRYDGFISPLVAKRYAEYMHIHRIQPNGELRAPDNWKKGIPLPAYADSLIRHVMDFWLHVEGFPEAAVEQDIEKVLCAIRFNTDGYLFEVLKKKAGK